MKGGLGWLGLGWPRCADVLSVVCLLRAVLVLVLVR